MKSTQCLSLSLYLYLSLYLATRYDCISLAYVHTSLFLGNNTVLWGTKWWVSYHYNQKLCKLVFRSWCQWWRLLSKTRELAELQLSHHLSLAFQLYWLSCVLLSERNPTKTIFDCWKGYIVLAIAGTHHWIRTLIWCESLVLLPASRFEWCNSAPQWIMDNRCKSSSLHPASGDRVHCQCRSGGASHCCWCCCLDTRCLDARAVLSS